MTNRDRVSEPTYKFKRASVEHAQYEKRGCEEDYEERRKKKTIKMTRWHGCGEEETERAGIYGEKVVDDSIMEQGEPVGVCEEVVHV